MRRHISQREAHWLRKRVKQLEDERLAMVKRWGGGFPGTPIGATINGTEYVRACIKTAQQLKRPVVVRVEGECLEFYAVKVTP